jgi:hypothetical protein
VEPDAKRPVIMRVHDVPTDGSWSAWSFVGAVPEDNDDGGAWGGRTGLVRAVRPTRVQTGVSAVLIDGDWGVWPLQARGGRGGSPSDVVAVGRASSNDICIADAGISKVHARVRVTGDELWIADASSSNGTLVNGDVVGAAEVPLADGDLVRFGPKVVQVLSPAHLVAVVTQLRRTPR